MTAQKLIVFSAPSGSGKTTLIKHLLAENLPLAFSISATSRTPRKGEINGKDYYFLSGKDFQKKIKNGDFLEWEEVYKGTFYGTLRSELERIWAKNKAVLFDIDVVGGLNLKKLFPKETLAVFVKAPSIATMEKRLTKRGTDTPQVIAKRIKKARVEMGFEKEFDTVLINDDLEVAKKMAVNMVVDFLKN